MVDETLENIVETKMVMRPTQAESGYTPLSTAAGEACANCRFFDGDMSMCALIENYPESILPTGYCSRHEAPPSMETAVENAIPTPVVIVEDFASKEPTFTTVTTDGGKTWTGTSLPIPQVSKPESFLSHFKATIAEALRGKAELPVAFKVVGNHWFARWSNTFRDRDGEHFATKAHDDYILRVKMGVTPMPRLWVNHLAGSDHGTARVVARIGHFTIAAGDFDDTPKGKAAKRYYERHKAEGVSHGFAFDKNQLIDGVYHQYNTFEISPLFGKLPANPFTTFEEVQNMKIAEQDIKLLKDMFGEDIVNNEIITKTEQASKALEEAGVAFKDFVDPQPTSIKADDDCVQGYMDEGMSEEDAKAKCAETKAARGDKALATLVMDILQDHASVVTAVDAMGKAIKSRDAATNETVENLKQELAEMKALLDQRPRVASKDDATLVDEKDVNPAVLKDMKDIQKDKFWDPAS